jgi:hypothetical protein
MDIGYLTLKAHNTTTARSSKSTTLSQSVMERAVRRSHDLLSAHEAKRINPCPAPLSTNFVESTLPTLTVWTVATLDERDRGSQRNTAEAHGSREVE